MKNFTASFIVIPAVFLWIGFVGAISFMEAWLKFRAPGITLPLGLGIGKIVFSALNKVEWVLAFLTAMGFVKVEMTKWRTEQLLFILLFFLLSIQSFWLLPELGSRADALIMGKQLPPSKLHFYYVGMEVTKVLLLFVLGIRLIKRAAGTTRSVVT